MKKLNLLLISALALLLSSAILSCTNDNDDDPKPNECDTSSVSYTNDIAPIISQNCGSGCHNGETPSSGFRLDSYQALKDEVGNGRILGAINQQAGFVAMPQNSAPIPECDRDRIEAWISAGAPNN